ncbi:retrovirus-related pol polyprotein from transposon TNT 1-94 [Tanacetum coccineum]
MDSVIPLEQKNTFAEYMLLSGANNRPPILDKDLYDSWKSRMELYMQNREHGRMILELVENGPLIWPTVEENGVTRTKKYVELSVAKKIQADCDMKATNIILQGLPADIYSLVNHHRVAKDLWDTRETLHKYYLRFTQLINDINIYNMKIEQFQVNTKFLNSLPPEWSKFVIDVKLVKDLHTTNFDQLHTYREQHELHANEVYLLRERNQDPLAFVENQQMIPPHFNTYQSSYNNTHIQQQFPPSQYGSIHPTQHFSSTYPSQPQFNHSSVQPSYPYQSQMNHQTSSIPQIAYQSPQVSTQPLIELPLMDSSFAVLIFSLGDDPIACLNKEMAFLIVVASSSNATSSRGNNASRQARVVKCYNCQGEGHMARQCTKPKRPRNAAWYKDKAMLAEAQEAGQTLDEEQLAFLADPGVPDGQAVQTIIPNNAAFQAEDLNTYDSDYDDISNAKSVLMANISNYGFDVISEVPHSETYLIDMENQAVHAMHDFEQPPAVDLQIMRYISESKEKEDTYIENEIDLEKKIKELDNILFKVGYQNLFHLKKAQRIKPTLYDGIAMSDKHVVMPVIDDEKTLILEEASRSKMSEKAKDPEVINKNISHKPIDYEKLNRLTEDFGKCFTPQQELSAEEAFWLRMSDPTSKPSDALPVKIEARKELPMVSLVNESLKKLKFHLAKFDNVVKIRTTPNARTEGEFFDQMDVAVQQSSVDKQCLEIAKKELLLENDLLLKQIIKESCNLEAELLKSQNAFNDLLKRHSQLEKDCIYLECSIQLNQEIFQKRESCDNQNALEILEFFENNDLKAQLQDKDSTICKLKDMIKSMREKSKDENIKYDYCEIEIKNVELENSVAKLLSENECLCNEINYVKQVLKEQFDSIKQTRVRSKEHSDSLVDKLNLKSA